MPDRYIGVQIGQLIEEGVIEAWDGHGSPKASLKGTGNIPYIRVADIVNWELYRNPVANVPLSEYERLTKNKPSLKAEDVIFVRRGSYRIGTVAMVSPRDDKLLLTRELLTLRVLSHNNDYGITSFYLLAMLSSPTVQNQLQSKVFVDTTLPNIGDRWKSIVLPIHEDKSEIQRISNRVERSIRDKWAAQNIIDKLRKTLGDLVT